MLGNPFSASVPPPAASSSSTSAATTETDQLSTNQINSGQGQQQQGSQATTSNELPRPYKCPMCAKAFHRLEHQTRHIRTHTGEKPHSCSFPGCTKRFSRSDELTRHARIHTNPNSRRNVRGNAAVAQAQAQTQNTATSAKSSPNVSPRQGFNSVASKMSGVPTQYHSGQSLHVAAAPLTTFDGQMDVLATAAAQQLQHEQQQAQLAQRFQYEQSQHATSSMSGTAYQPSQYRSSPGGPAAYGGPHISSYGQGYPQATHKAPAISLPMSRQHSQEDEDSDRLSSLQHSSSSTALHSLAHHAHHASYASLNTNHGFRRAVDYDSHRSKRSRPGSPIGTAPNSPIMLSRGTSPTPDHTPLATPAHSPRLHPRELDAINGFHLPSIRSLSLRGTPPALAPLEVVDPFQPGSGYNSPNPRHAGPVSASRLSDILESTSQNASERTLPVPRLSINDMIHSNNTPMNPPHSNGSSHQSSRSNSRSNSHTNLNALSKMSQEHH